MVICGVKLTHDAAVAIVADGRLVFSVEMEKIGNAERHKEIYDLADVFETLATENVSLSDIDVFSFDGWRTPEQRCSWEGAELRLGNGPYRRGLHNDSPLHQGKYHLWDLEYVSFPHYSGHVVGAYSASPYAVHGDDAYVLCWDGAMFPCLYEVRARTGTILPRGLVFHLLGDVYHEVAQLFPPFNDGTCWPKTMALPGKIMAYVARGRANLEVVSGMMSAYRRVAARMRCSDRADVYCTERFGRQIIGALKVEIDSASDSASNMLASWHAFLEILLVEQLQAAVTGSRLPNLIMAGGAALNIKWNRAVRSCGLFGDVWVPPFPNDSGSAIGAACCAMAVRSGLTPLSWNVYSGPDIRVGSLPPGWNSRPCTISELAQLLHETGEPVVFLNGRAEIGPRALGNRSILASPVEAVMKERLNEIKEREDYRPVAPVCLESKASEIFEPGEPDPYMLYERHVRPTWRGRIPAVCHEDGTARVQTVSESDHPVLWMLLREYERLSGVPVLCNTSANLPGRGFFPDVQSAAAWGKVPFIWSAGKLYHRDV